MRCLTWQSTFFLLFPKPHQIDIIDEVVGWKWLHSLAKTLKTANKPLDGAININWGTAMYSWILTDKRVKGLEGKKLRDAALSIYQRGTGGYDKYGVNKKFLAKYYKKRNLIVSYFDD